MTPETLAAENLWRRSLNKRRQAKPGKNAHARLKRLSAPSAKRSGSPFFAFAAEERARLARSGEGVKSVTVFAKEMGGRWKALSDSEKAVRPRYQGAHADNAGLQALSSRSLCLISVRLPMRLCNTLITFFPRHDRCSEARVQSSTG